MKNTAKKQADEIIPLQFDKTVQKVLDSAGNLVGDMPEIDDSQLEALFRSLIKTRTFDESALRLQRTGRIPAYYACAGMEAHVAIPAALEDRDWVFTAYREQGVRLGRGVPASTGIESPAILAKSSMASLNSRPSNCMIKPMAEPCAPQPKQW